MSWIPPNLAQACAIHTTITTCQPQTALFLQLVTFLFGQSKDSPIQPNSYFPVYNNDEFDFTKIFDQTLNTDYGFNNNGHTSNTGYGFINNGHNSNTGYGFGSHKPKIEEFDFIVVGAGSAGCVVANRLTEVPEWRVLLLEAGSEEPEVASVPAFAPLLQRSSIDWAFMTEPSPHSCLARRNGQCIWEKGRVMGGSSTVNYMIYIRGHPQDYDEWEAMGNHGWSYRDVLPYFKKSEKNLDHKKVLEEYHGRHGYQPVQRFPYQDKNVWALLDAFAELGLPIHDQNGEDIIGASLLQHTQHDGRRVSTNVAFIRPIRHKRENLVVRTNSEVLRILINPKTKTAYGVEYLKNGEIVQAIAKKEVILSAGAIMSPKVLMLSGVGPAHELHNFNIPIIKELPGVGQNLQDHTTMDGVIFVLTNKSSTAVSDQQMTDDVYYYKETSRGPLSAPGTIQVNAFVQTKYEYEHGRPDIQYSCDVANVKNFVTDPILAAETTVIPSAYYTGLQIRPVLMNPESRGEIRLNTSDPVYGVPLIYAGTFTKEIDLARIVDGAQQSLNLLKTHSLSKLGYTLLANPMPACQNYKFASDEYWACVARSYTATIFHASGTCKMGPKNDEHAVVDSKLRVYGINHLRVIDSSIMPKIVRGNTNAPTIMIAEKGSDFIKEKWLHKSDEHSSSLHSDFFFNK